MKQLFNEDELHRIRDQSALYDCACPAQLCKEISEVRTLHAYQLKCGRDNALDIQIHERIAAAAEVAHEALEHCLRDVLAMEGWNPDTLEMPAAIQARRLQRG